MPQAPPLGVRCITCGWRKRLPLTQDAPAPPDAVLAHLAHRPDHELQWPVEVDDSALELSQLDQAVALGYRRGHASATAAWRKWIDNLPAELLKGPG